MPVFERGNHARGCSRSKTSIFNSQRLTLHMEVCKDLKVLGRTWHDFRGLERTWND